MLTNQFTPAALEWGFGGRRESGLPVGTSWRAPWWGCSKCCRGGTAPVGVYVCGRVCVREICVSVCVRKGAWGRRSSPEVWGSEGCAPFSPSDTPQLPAGDPTVRVLLPHGAWGWQVSLRGCLCPGAPGCCRGADSTPCFAHSWLRLQEAPEMGWGTPCVSSPSAVPVAGQGDRALSQPWSDLKLKIPGEMPVLAPGPLHGQAGGGGLSPSDPQALGPCSPFAGGGGIPGRGLCVAVKVRISTLCHRAAVKGAEPWLPRAHCNAFLFLLFFFFVPSSPP